MNATTETIALPTSADVDAVAARIKGVAIRTPLKGRALKLLAGGK